MPEQLRRSLSRDPRAETAQRARLKLDTYLKVYRRNPHTPAAAGTNENTDGLRRRPSRSAPT